MRLNEFRSIVFLHVIKRICISFICIFICLITLVVFSEGFYAENTSDISSENTQTQPSDGSRNDTDSHTQSEKEPKDIIASAPSESDGNKELITVILTGAFIILGCFALIIRNNREIKRDKESETKEKKLETERKDLNE